MKMLLLAIALIAMTGCAGLQTQHQKIAAACSAVQTAGQAIADATNAGKISKVDAAKATVAYHATDRFCEPPVSSLSADDYASLLSSAAALAATAGSAK